MSPAHRGAARIAALAAWTLGTLFLVAPHARAAPPLVRAIAPGNDATIATMLGNDAALPDACTLGDVRVDRTFIVARYRCGGLAPEVELRHRDDPAAPRGAMRTERFAVTWRGDGAPALTQEVTRRIRAGEAAFHFITVGAPVGSEVARRRDESPGWVRAAGRAEAGIAFLLLALALPAMGVVFRQVRDAYFGADRSFARAFGVVVGAGAAVRLVAPLTMVTMYIGYLLTEQSIELQIDSHYGLGSQALYHALFRILPHDHRTLMRIDSVVGMFTIPIVATLAARLSSDRRTGIVAGALVAFTPLFVKNDNSDANNVPVMFWLTGGLLLAERFLRSREAASLAGAVVLASFAAVSRPEMPVLVPLALLAVAASVPAETRSAALRDRRLWLGVATFVVLAMPHALHVLRSAGSLAEGDGLPAASGSAIRDAFVRGWWQRNTLLTPTLYPLALVPLALVALRVPDRAVRRGRIALLAVSVVALGVYGVDLCVANMARVHALPALLFSLLSAMGFVAMVDRANSPRGRRSVAAALAAAIGVTALPTALRLWAPTNEQAEETFLRLAIARLPVDAPFTFVRIAGVDGARDGEASDRTHRHFPDYLLRPPIRAGRSSSITDFLEDPDLDHPAYFYAGTRCYAQFRTEGTPAPHGETLQPACRAMRERFVLVPVVERSIVNRGDVWLEYYGDAPRLRLGLYRIEPR